MPANNVSRTTMQSIAVPGPCRVTGLTLIELCLALAIMGVLAVMGTSQYGQYRDRMLVTQAIFDIGALETRIAKFAADNRVLPAALTDLGGDLPKDPWGHDYQYLSHENAKGKSGFRKDKHIVPINTDYDLYSMGKDGASVPPLTAKASRDDIVRASDGRFVGLASDFDP